LAIPLILAVRYSGVILIGTTAVPVVPEVGKSGVGTYSIKPVVPSIYADSTTGLDRASTP
jgi:hypothetical protein